MHASDVTPLVPPVTMVRKLAGKLSHCTLSMENHKFTVIMTSHVIDPFNKPGSNVSYTTGRDEIAWSHDPGPYITIPQYRFNQTKQHTRRPCKWCGASVQSIGQCLAKLIHIVMRAVTFWITCLDCASCWTTNWKLGILTMYRDTEECVSRKRAKVTFEQHIMPKLRLLINSLSMIIYNEALIFRASLIATLSGCLPQKRFTKKDPGSRLYRVSWLFLTGIVTSISCAFSASSSLLYFYIVSDHTQSQIRNRGINTKQKKSLARDTVNQGSIDHRLYHLTRHLRDWMLISRFYITNWC